MSHPFARSGCRFAAVFGIAFAAAAPVAAQKTYSAAFTATPAATTIFAYDGTIQPTGGSPTFNRPGLDAPNPLGTLSPKGTNVAYAVNNFTVTTAGTYRVVCDSVQPTAWDNCVYVYKTGFNPAAPLTNCIAGNNAAFGTGHSGFASLTLTPGTYVLVTTAYYNTVAGTFAVSVTPTAGAVSLTFSATTTAAPTWDRPDLNNNALSTFATATPYYAYSFTATATGTYRFLSECTNPSDWDDYTLLYRDSFSATAPLSNLITSNDDLNGPKSSGFISNLTAGSKYVFVTTGALNQSSGDFTGYITAPGTGVALLSATGKTTAPTGAYLTYNRPSVNGVQFPRWPDQLADNVYYATHPFTVAKTGLYNFKTACTTPAVWENFMVLYRGSFDPTTPLFGALFAVGGNDPSTQVIENVPLTAGTPYVWVTTSYLNGEGGAFHNTLYTGGAAFPPTIPDNSGKGLPLTVHVADTFAVGALNKVVITGLKHSNSGDLLATLTHGGVTIELFDRLGVAKDGDPGSNAAFNGDYTFAASGADLGAAITDPINPAVAYRPYLNGTAGQSSTLTGDFTAFNGQSAAGDWTLNISDLDGQFIGSYSGFSLTLTPQTQASASGTIEFEGINPNIAPAQTVTFTCRPTGGGAAIVKTAFVPRAGQFTISGLPLQPYTFHIKGDLYLASNIPADLTAGDVTGLNVFLRAGDSNNDNSCDSSDFTALIGSFNSDAHDPTSGYDPTADFNLDGTVDSGDFTLLIGEFNTVGDP